MIEKNRCSECSDFYTDWCLVRSLQQELDKLKKEIEMWKYIANTTHTNWSQRKCCLYALNTWARYCKECWQLIKEKY